MDMIDDQPLIRRERSRSPVPRKQRNRRRSPRGGGGGGGRLRDGVVSNNTQRDENHLQRSRIFVGNVEPSQVSREDLTSIFSRYGEVIAVSIHKGYAFIQMDYEKNANKAIYYENNASLHGKRLNVEFSSAALKAGARYRSLSRERSPPRERDRYYNSTSSRDMFPPPPRDYPPREYPPLAADPWDSRMSRVLALERELQKERAQLHQEDPIDVYYTNGGRRGPPPSSSFVSYPGSYYEQGSARDTDYLISRSGSGSGGMGSGRRDPTLFDGAGGPSLARPLSPRLRPNQVESYNTRVSDRLGGRMPFDGSSWDPPSRAYQQPHW